VCACVAVWCGAVDAFDSLTIRSSQLIIIIWDKVNHHSESDQFQPDSL
jgi:hypothetical protein